MITELLVLASVFLMGFVWGWCGCYRMCLKNERQGVYSEPEGVDPCVGKGEHVMDAYGYGMALSKQINKAGGKTTAGYRKTKFGTFAGTTKLILTQRNKHE